MVEMEEESSTYSRWRQSTKTLLGAVSKETCHPYSIPVVPDELRKWNESAYMPKVVSIGPRYRGKRELLQTEDIKWRCVTSLLSRAFGTGANHAIEICMEAVLKLDAAVRASYVDEITLDRYTLATTMIFDGCFLLELLICESNLDSEIPIPFNGISPGIEVKKMEYVISDLLLLENQIPIFILETLFEKLIGSSRQMREDIQNLALPLLGFSGKLMANKPTFHFLDIAYSYIEMGWVDKKIEGNHVQIRIFDTVEEEEEEDKKKKHLKRCATRLKAAGITIQRLNKDVDPINFKYTTEFNKRQRILKIPKLTITKTTEVSWRSFIAWEHHKKKLKRSSSSVADRHSICTSSAILFRDLICCSSDVQLLKDRGVIIVDRSHKSNRDLVAFFHSIAGGVDRSIIDYEYITMFHELNTFSTPNYITKIFILLCHLFCKILDRCYNVNNFLKRGYNFAATMVTFLTVVQTCYTILAYHLPSK